jgi:hypothetical protein
MGREGVPLCRGSLLWDAEVGSDHGHRAVVEHVVPAQPALEDNLCLRGGGGSGGGEDRMLKKRHLHRLTDADFLKWVPFGSVDA